jgi:hypothetical protein
MAPEGCLTFPLTERSQLIPGPVALWSLSVRIGWGSVGEQLDPNLDKCQQCRLASACPKLVRRGFPGVGTEWWGGSSVRRDMVPGKPFGF